MAQRIGFVLHALESLRDVLADVWCGPSNRKQAYRAAASRSRTPARMNFLVPLVTPSVYKLEPREFIQPHPQRSLGLHESRSSKDRRYVPSKKVPAA